MRIILTAKVQEILDEDRLKDVIAQKVLQEFDSTIGPHAEKVARQRAPVGKREHRAQRSTLQRVVPIPSKGAGAEIAGLSGPERVKAFRAAFGESTTKKSITSLFRGVGSNRTKNPDELRLANNTIKGAFTHKSGTLRDSIRYVGAKRVGDQVIGTVRAHAPYAMPVHQGFNHRGGRAHTGKTTKVPPNPFLASSLANINEELKGVGKG